MEDVIVHYQEFPNFIKVITNQDVEELIANYDNMTDSEIVLCDCHYKLCYYSSRLTDEQLLRLVKITNILVYDIDELLSNGETRYHILAHNTVPDSLFERGLSFTENEEFYKYIIKNNKISDRALNIIITKLIEKEKSDVYISRLTRVTMKLLKENSFITKDQLRKLVMI